MPTEEPFYVITVQRMMKCDGASCVASWSGITSEEKFRKTFASADDAIRVCVEALEGVPLDNVRPMTRDEITEYRDTE